MKNIIKIVSIAVVLALGGTSMAAEEDPLLNAIKARKADMTLRNWNVGPLFGMVEGDIEYDAELASALANNLKLLTQANNGTMWPEGSDNQAYPDDSHALPENWTNYPDAAEKWNAYVDAVAVLADVAGNGLDQLQSAIGDVGDGCQGCHDDFREELD